MGKKSKAIILLGIFTLTPLLFCCCLSDDDDRPDNTTTCIKTDQDSTAIDSTAAKMQTKSNELNNY